MPTVSVTLWIAPIRCEERCDYSPRSGVVGVLKTCQWEETRSVASGCGKTSGHGRPWVGYKDLTTWLLCPAACFLYRNGRGSVGRCSCILCSVQYLAFHQSASVCESFCVFARGALFG